MSHTIRGKINYKKRRQQIIDMSSLCYGNKTPTDIDGYLDFGDKASVFFELKLEGTSIDRGQELAFERLTNDVSWRGKPTIYIVADHAVYDVKKQIPAHTCLVRKYYYKGKWYPASSKYPMLIDLIDCFLKEHGFNESKRQPKPVQNKSAFDEDGNPKDDSWMEGL